MIGGKFYFQEVTCPQYYRRYVDDIFCLFKESSLAGPFLEFLNSVHLSTKFDMEMENGGQLNFLDTTVKRSSISDRPDISTHIKPTDKGLKFHFSSFVPDLYKTNLIRCLVHRIYMIGSSYTLIHKGIEELVAILKGNGFPEGFIRKQIKWVLDKFQSADDDVSPVVLGCKKREIIMVLPYLGPMSLLIRRNVTNLVHKFYPTVSLKIVFARGYKLQNMFNFKDKLPLKCRSGVMYYIMCKNCGSSSSYGGITVNTLYERFYGSNGHLNPSTKKSALIEHICTSDNPLCEWNFDEIKILDSSDDQLRLRYIESITLKYEPPTLNTQEWSIPLHVV